MFLGICYLILTRVYVHTLILLSQLRKLIQGYKISKTELRFKQRLSHSIPEFLTTKVGVPGGEDMKGHVTWMEAIARL